MPRARGQGRPNSLSDRPRFGQAEARQNDQQGVSRPANCQIGTAYRLRQRLADTSGRFTRSTLIGSIGGIDIEEDDAQMALFTAQARQLTRDSDVTGGSIEQRRREVR